MGRIVTTISLDEQSAEIAKNLPNLSQWIRTQLIMHHLMNGGEPIHVAQYREHRNYVVRVPIERDGFGRVRFEEYNTRRCNPHHKKGRCEICWPSDLSIEEHILRIAAQVREGNLDPFCEGEEE
jgi:hypothetical protein